MCVCIEAKDEAGASSSSQAKENFSHPETYRCPLDPSQDPPVSDTAGTKGDSRGAIAAVPLLLPSLLWLSAPLHFPCHQGTSTPSLVPSISHIAPELTLSPQSIFCAHQLYLNSSGRKRLFPLASFPSHSSLPLFPPVMANTLHRILSVTRAMPGGPDPGPNSQLAPSELLVASHRPRLQTRQG